MKTLTSTSVEILREAALDQAPVASSPGQAQSPHEFYRYPARFSPRFAEAAIRCFSEPGDLIVDPFVGGGTTAVEGQRLNRQVVAADINPIATFVTRVKTAPLGARDLVEVEQWLSAVPRRLKINLPAPSFCDWSDRGYFKDIERRDTWRLKKLLALALATLPQHQMAADFCRCIVLRTGQWALDMRSVLPTAPRLRDVLIENGQAMLSVARELREIQSGSTPPIVLDTGLPGLADQLTTVDARLPALVITSPPYPGVYVNYHRWKLRGRREIPAPYWIANRQDGHGLAHYTMSARAEPTLDVYFNHLTCAFTDLARMVGPDTVVAQMVGFNDPTTQLDRYLQAMSDSGFTETRVAGLASAEDGRLWRVVPGRRWWTQAQANRTVAPHTAREVVLLHHLL